MLKMNDFERCVKERRLVKIKPSKEMIQKELESAEYDLERARNSLDQEDFKWAAVQSYYSMFHAAKALVLKKGYREKSHFCLFIALKELYVNEDKLNAEMVENLELCMNLRHEADYGLTYHQESAETAIKYAEVFLNNALKLL
jgi:uncharacterized protein (UPF0332 family)